MVPPLPFLAVLIHVFKCGAKVPSTACHDCGREIDEAADLPGRRAPCANCGGTKRVMHAEILLRGSSSVIVRKMLNWERKSQGRWGKDGWDLFNLTGKWNRLKRTFDKPNDQYKEEIMDGETGELIRECNEPLSQHRARGSAKWMGQATSTTPGKIPK